jgi:serine/threonine protein kinase
MVLIGNFGEVFLAKSNGREGEREKEVIALKRFLTIAIQVALKLLTDKSLTSEFEKEQIVLRSWIHRSKRKETTFDSSQLRKRKKKDVVKFLGIQIAEGNKYLVFEYMSEGSLHNLLMVKGNTLKPKDMINFAVDIAEVKNEEICTEVDNMNREWNTFQDRR